MITDRKLNINKNFIPATASEGDELYPNGIFLFNITKMIAYIKNNSNKFKVEDVDIHEIRKIPSSKLNEETVKEANLSNPIILAEISPSNFNVIDGNHRLEKAYRNNKNKILAYKVYAEDHIAFLTSENAYKSYIEYWNSKLKTLHYSGV